MLDNVCEVDLTDAPLLQAILIVCREGGLSDSQAERIGHRSQIIDSLTRVIEKSTSAAFIQRANWIIEDKKHEIEAIVSEEATLRANHENAENTSSGLSMAGVAALPRL